MRKAKFFIDFAKEEAWLADMAKQGWKLTRVSSFSVKYFEQDEPHPWNYRVDYRTFKSHQDFADYVQLFEDGGWYHIAGTKWSGSQYFVQVRPDVPNDIFSDAASKAARYHKQSMLYLAIALLYTFGIVIGMANGSVDINMILHPTEFYLTPGLWEREGFQFWGAFLIETPFALMRGYAWTLYTILLAGFTFVALRSYWAGRKLRFPAIS